MIDADSWTRRSEADACCGHALGPVRDEEAIARLLHTGIAEPDHEPFKRKELFPQKSGFTNECGNADGCSVIRSDALTAEALRERSRAQAEQKPGRKPLGALLTSASKLRGLRRPTKLSQITYIYDDPLPDDDRHAVLRGCENIEKADQDEARVLIKSAFSHSIIQDNSE